MQSKNAGPAPRPRGRPSRGVREAILAAVPELIRERGLAGVTTSAVAQRAGTSEASIHYHFGGKEQLVEEAILAAVGSLRSRAREVLGAARQPAQSLEQLTAALESFYDELIPLLVAVQSDPQLRRELGPKLALNDLGPHRAVSLVAGWVTKSQAERTGGGDDADAAALLLVGACFLRAWQRQLSTHRVRALPSLARAVNVLLQAESDPEPSGREP
ncbi:MAG TPA: TetR/AcrR family transcriptional regulator [Solirubrobacteraceae bacterium]|nr:TetR/AcrR family transcriptional regulator [Solirubrobacteraceae bacterium]